VAIYGAGKFAKELYTCLHSSGYEVVCFFESRKPTKSSGDVPTYSMLDFPPVLRECQLLIGIFNRSVPFRDLVDCALLAGFSDVFLPWDFYHSLADLLGWRYWLSPREHILENLDEIANAYELFSDDRSRNVFLRILNFRLGLDLDFSAFSDPEPQYFNRLTIQSGSNKSIVYADCGAFNGDTVIDLSQRSAINSAFLFEPDPANYAKLCENLRGSTFPYFALPLAVSKKAETLTFSSGEGEGAALSSSGDISVQAVSLDDALHGDIDFIKIDVEGGETAALEGSSRIIRDSSPILAISLYHKPSDIWELPLLIDSLAGSGRYQYFVRQHMFNSFDSVFYASAFVR
jgi:FkbM family methyltransferase